MQFDVENLQQFISCDIRALKALYYLIAENGFSDVYTFFVRPENARYICFQKFVERL
jgi:hypothetical protein